MPAASMLHACHPAPERPPPGARARLQILDNLPSDPKKSKVLLFVGVQR